MRIKAHATEKSGSSSNGNTCPGTGPLWGDPLVTGGFPSQRPVRRNFDFLCVPEQMVEQTHYNGVIMGAMASQITSITIVCSTVSSGAHQRKHQSSASLAFVRGIHRSPVNAPHKWSVTRKMFPFDDVIINNRDASDLGCHGGHCHVTVMGLTKSNQIRTVHHLIISLFSWFVMKNILNLKNCDRENNTWKIFPRIEQNSNSHKS